MSGIRKSTLSQRRHVVPIEEDVSQFRRHSENLSGKSGNSIFGKIEDPKGAETAERRFPGAFDVIVPQVEDLQPFHAGEDPGWKDLDDVVVERKAGEVGQGVEYVRVDELQSVSVQSQHP